MLPDIRAPIVHFDRRSRRKESGTMKISTLIPIACSLTLAAPLHAAETGDAQAGAQKNAMCKGCHGIPGYKTVFPEVYSVPKIGGQHPAYLVKALQEYK